ncbi:prephenate dehydrogenase/arogenate dehydrogenase family protein [Natrononativus amylolyticus]|uniref:prephenate dehydrogenase/arogenate dehydrogenase family protein n=1 Tax=Natrononativus amylolyticus TaxID=2963434 RepID=UPI0020CFBD41|nr:prephenate dehydrogenase/arogenate dehydrogenase family protein [Natrononativus amylolyticus]
MDVLIVGAGSMGRWFARATDARATFADVDPDVAAEAADAVGGAVDALEGDRRYDAVCLAVPMSQIETSVESHVGRAERAVLDVSGVMGAPLAAMAEAAPDLERASLHPLFAPERAPGTVAVVRARSGPVVEGLLEDIESRGNELLETTAAEHDEAMETVQAATHTAVLAFALAADPVPEGFGTPIYDELLALAGQVTGGTPRVYADIQRTFDGAEDVSAAASSLAAAEGEAFESLYRRAGEQVAAAASRGDGE